MGKYKWNLGMGCFCGLVVNKVHADLNGKETQILYNKSPYPL
jgi:hypothetical protein